MYRVILGLGCINIDTLTYSLFVYAKKNVSLAPQLICVNISIAPLDFGKHKVSLAPFKI